MTNIFLKYDDSSARRVLNLIAQRGNDLTPVMSAASLEMHKDVIQRFQDEEDETGKAWAPLSPVTIARRKNKNKGSIKILRDKGRLIGSIKPRHGILYAAVSAGTEYAATHNFGDPSRNIKQRAFMRDLSKSTHKKIFTLITKHLMTGA